MAKGLSNTTKNLIRLSRGNNQNAFIDAFIEVNGGTRAQAAEVMGGFAVMDDNGNIGDSSSSSSGGGIGKGVGLIGRMLSTQEQKVPGDSGEFLTAQKGIDTFFDSSGKFKGIWKSIGSILEDQIVIGLQQSTDLLGEMNTEAGMTGALSKEFRQEIMSASPAVIRLGISFEELKTSVSKVVSESGKFKLLGKETIEDLARTSVFTSSMEDMAGMVKGFEEIGLGVSDMTKLIDDAGHSALELGLNAKAVTKGIDNNLGKINQYGFKDGVAGLTRMVEKSVEFRMNMEDVFAVADKVWDPEGALEMVSNLQVIGGAIGDLNDPIKLMYMATNDVEGLQTAIQGAAKSLVTYNNEQGRFEVTGANLRKAKEMADTLGISMGELTKTAVAGMERTQAASELMSRGIQMDEGDREFLTNLAQMKDGKMTIEIPEDLQKQLGGNVELSNITKEQTDALLANRDAFKVISTEDIARNQYTAVQNIEHDLSFLAAKARVGIGKEMGDAIEKFISADAGGKLAKGSYEGTNVAAGYIDDAQGWVSKVIADNAVTKPLLDRNDAKVDNSNLMGNVPEDTKTKEKSTGMSEANAVKKAEVLFSFRSTDNIMDEVKRSIWGDKKFAEDVKNKISGSFLTL